MMRWCIYVNTQRDEMLTGLSSLFNYFSFFCSSLSLYLSFSLVFVYLAHTHTYVCVYSNNTSNCHHLYTCPYLFTLSICNIYLNVCVCVCVCVFVTLFWFNQVSQLVSLPNFSSVTFIASIDIYIFMSMNTNRYYY